MWLIHFKIKIIIDKSFRFVQLQIKKNGESMLADFLVTYFRQRSLNLPKTPNNTQSSSIIIYVPLFLNIKENHLFGLFFCKYPYINMKEIPFASFYFIDRNHDRD